MELIDDLDGGKRREFQRRMQNVFQSLHCLRASKLSDCTILEHLQWTFLILALSTVLLLFSKRIYVKRTNKKGLPTPPGSKGWPLLGDTYSFIHTEDTADFVRRRVKKYGEIFYANIVGYPHVVVHTPEFVRFMLVDPLQVLMGGMPKYVQKLFRPGAIPNYQGKVHTEKYSLLLKSMSSKNHEAWLAGFNDVMKRTVDSWKGRTINCHNDSQKMFIDTGFIFIFGMVNSDEKVLERLSHDIQGFSHGLVSLPIKIPGTGFERGLQARKNIDQEIVQKLQRHLKMREEGVKPQFYSVMESFLDNLEQTGKELNSKDPDCVNTILDQLALFPHGQFEGTSHIFTWMIKFLSENPEVLQKVKAEQEAIRSTKEGLDYSITEQDLTKMTYSRQVLQETLRLASVVGTILRQVKSDFEYKGYTIPKDWTLHVGLRSIHHNPDYFQNPKKFDPSRFEDPASIRQDTFLPFGFGNRGCVAKTVVKKQILLAMHYVTTRLRWTPLDPTATTLYNPQAHVKGGYPIKVHLD